MTKNGSTPWANIKEISASHMEELTQVKRTQWAELWDDIRLRLEQTPPSKALEIAFPDESAGFRATQALRRSALREGVDIILRTRKDGNGGRIVYVRRGPTWSK